MNQEISISRWWPFRENRRQESCAPPDFSEIHATQVDFVFASLQRLGVREDDLEDLLQEVFIIVQQRLHTFDPSGSLEGWLFGICRNIASVHRRRAYVRHERPSAAPIDVHSAAGEPDPEEAAQRREAQARLDAILDELDADKRAVFVMFEIDELPCDAIAAALGIPLGTVYSRLHAARKAFEKALARHGARDRKRGRP